jgi:protein-tyrosine-phosphatase
MAMADTTRDPVPKSILYACSFNSIRSPMAAALTCAIFGERFRVRSAGVRPGEPDLFAVAVMKEIGIDISDYRPVSFAEIEGESFELIVSLSPEAQHQAVELTRSMPAVVEYWPTFDPTAVEGSRDQRLAAYRMVRDALSVRIRERLDAP